MNVLVQIPILRLLESFGLPVEHCGESYQTLFVPTLAY